MLIIHDKRLPGEYIKALKKKLPDAYLFPFKGIRGAVYDSISRHPDIYFFRLDKRTVIHAPGVPHDTLEFLAGSGVKLIKGEKDPFGSYPDTARYNAARVGDIVFHNLEHTDPVILREVRERGLKCVNVKQGYTRCSILALGYNAIITEDKGIAEAAAGEGAGVLLIPPGHVKLPGEQRGFIGGAAGCSDGQAVVVLGGIDTHAKSEEIKDFMSRYASSFIELPGMPLYDAGSLICLETR